MKFDLNWFTTIPGLLITCGILLLVIALIIFIITSVKGKKSKKGEEGMNNQNVNQAALVNQPNVSANNVGGNATLQVDPNAISNNQTVPTNNVSNDVNNVAVNNNGVVNPPLNTVNNVNPGMVDLNVAPAPTIPVAPVTPGNNQLPEILDAPAPSVPTPDEMLAVSQASNVNVPVNQNIGQVPGVSTVLENVASNDVSAVSTQNIPNVDVVSSAPTIDVVQPAPVTANFQENVVSEPAMINPINNIFSVDQGVQQMDVSSNNLSIDNSITGVNYNTDVNNDNVLVNEQVQPQESVPSFTQPVVDSQVSPAVNYEPVVNNLESVASPLSNTDSAPVSIYGGVSPVVPNFTNDVSTHQIYGGANPLENTQSVPIVNIANDNSYVANNNMNAVQSAPTLNSEPMEQYSAVSNQAAVNVQAQPEILTPAQEVYSNSVPVVNVDLAQPSISVVPDLNVQPVVQPQAQSEVVPQYQQPQVAPVNIQYQQPQVQVQGVSNNQVIQ